MSGETVADATAYWQRYYAEQFHFGLGTEDILAALMTIPPVDTWVDLGCGSESMLVRSRVTPPCTRTGIRCGSKSPRQPSPAPSSEWSRPASH